MDEWTNENRQNDREYLHISLSVNLAFQDNSFAANEQSE